MHIELCILIFGFCDCNVQAALKEEKKEARRAKKDLKVLYKCETQKAQKVAAVSGPSSIHLM